MRRFPTRACCPFFGGVLFTLVCIAQSAAHGESPAEPDDRATVRRFVLRVLRESEPKTPLRPEVPIGSNSTDEQRPDILATAALAKSDARPIKDMRQSLIRLETNERNCATAALRLIELSDEYQQLPKRKALREKVWETKRKKLETDFAERKRQDDERFPRQSVPIESNPADILLDRGPREEQRILTQNWYDRQSESLERQRERSMRAFELRHQRLESDFDALRARLNQYIKDGTFVDDPAGKPAADPLVPIAVVIEEVQAIRDELRHKLAANAMTSVQRAAAQEQFAQRERTTWQQPITANVLIDDISSYTGATSQAGGGDTGQGPITGDARTPRLIIHGRLADRVEVHMTLITRDATHAARNVGDTITVRLLVPTNPDNPLLEISAIEAP